SFRQGRPGSGKAKSGQRWIGQAWGLLVNGVRFKRPEGAAGSARQFAGGVQSRKIQLPCDTLPCRRACWGFRNRINDSSQGLSLLTGLKLTRWQVNGEGHGGF